MADRLRPGERVAVALVYYWGPDAEQDWIWISPGSLIATALWLIISLGFHFYIAHFGSSNATYGAIGGVIVLLLWFYTSSPAVAPPARAHASDWILSGLVLGELALFTYARLRSRFRRGQS